MENISDKIEEMHRKTDDFMAHYSDKMVYIKSWLK